MKQEDAKVGMRVYCTDNGEKGTIVDNEFSDYGCYVTFDNGEEDVFLEYELIEELWKQKN